MQHVDKNFMAEANNDYNLENGTISTTVASITTREIQDIETIGNDMYMNIDIPQEYKVDPGSFIKRPFYVDTVDFPATANRYTLLIPSVKFAPGDIARSNKSLTNMFKIAAYGRPYLTLNFSIAGTITHAGTVLVGVLPPLPYYPTNATLPWLINTILAGPHGFLHANEATSITIDVPWYCNTDMATMDMEQSATYLNTLDITETNGNYATIVYMVLNPLKPSVGSSTSLKIVVEAIFKNYDMVVPSPRFLDWVAQSKEIKRKQPTSMINPLYEDLELAMAQLNDTTAKMIKDTNRTRLLATITKLSPIISTVGTVLAITTAILRLALADESLGQPIDETKWAPQAGLISAGRSMVSGLLDNTTNGIKKITGDAIDAGRSWLRDYTGLHNPNVAINQGKIVTHHLNYNNMVDAQQYFEKLDPYTQFDRIVKEPIFNTSVDEMSISNITKKDHYIGTFIVSTSDAVGTLRWIRPISPFQGGRTSDRDVIHCSNNMELLHSMHRAWRGDLTLRIQSVMNNKQQVKLKVIKYYNPSTEVLAKVPTYASIANAPSHLLEYTQGGQVHDVSLPFLCRNDLCQTASATGNTDFEALFHGLYYIYVAQPLVNSDGSPTTIEFNVYLTSQNLQYYGYTSANTYHDNFGLGPAPTTALTYTRSKATIDPSWYTITKPFWPYAVNADELRSKVLEHNFGKSEAELAIIITDNGAKYRKFVDSVGVDLATKYFNNTDESLSKWDDEGRLIAVKKPEGKHTSSLGKWKAQAGNIKVMNEPQEQHNVVSADNKTITHNTRLMPTLDIRPLIRRMYKSYVNTFDIGPARVVNIPISLASVLGEDPRFWLYTPIETISRMYYGKTVGFKFRISVTVVSETKIDATQLTPRIYYVPQALNFFTGNKTITSAPPNGQAFPPGLVASTIGEIPLTYQIVPRESSIYNVIYEFVVPDTSFYKFLGSPDKFRDFDSNFGLVPLSTADFGSLMITFANNSVEDIQFAFELFVGLTDESRFGFQTIAPPFYIDKTHSYYLGTSTNPYDVPTPALNLNLYKGGYL